MAKEGYRAGYCDDGGIFIGRNIQSDFHQHHSIAVVLSFGKAFRITEAEKEPEVYWAALIPGDFSYSLSTDENDYAVFIHLDPYSDIGLSLALEKNRVYGFDRTVFLSILEKYKLWLKSEESSEQAIQGLLNDTVAALKDAHSGTRKIDRRILECIHYLRKSGTDNYSIKDAAERASLSKSRFSHLFREQTGVIFRQFVLHCKLVKSLKSIYNNENLTEAAFFGGFSDQPHFNKTFRKSFGIKPSRVKNS